MPPDIAVVVPTRNRASLLTRLLEQLTRLEGPVTYEVIVVDEASSDETPEVLARFADSHGFRSLRHDAPKGLSGARNAGTAAATAPYVAWIDDDDLTSPDRLRRQHAALVESGLRWSCAGRVDIYDDLRVIGHVRCPSAEELPEAILRSNPLPSAGQGLLVERALADEVGGYDEALPSSEDWDFCIRLAAVARPHFLDEPLVGYRTGTPSMSTDTARMERATRVVVSKYPQLYEGRGVRPDWHDIHHGLLAADLLTSRWRAAHRAARAAMARPSPKSIGLALAVLAVPEKVSARSRRRRVEQVPADWEAMARRWLDEVPPLPSPATGDRPERT
jgi:glycosyltransferase involved in cell wall biosynthesis